MTIDKFKPLTVYTIYIASTPEKVWEALTSAEFSRQYFFGNSVEIEQRVGGAFIVRTPDGALHISGDVMECDPPRRLSYTFDHILNDDMRQPQASKVIFVLEPHGDLVKLTLTHEGFTNNKLLAGISSGWPAILSNLKSLLETGRTLDIPYAAFKAED